MLPIILVAPHSQSTVDKELKDRFALTDYEIWKCSDPYTDQLDEFTCTASQHKADVNRLICDMNRAPNAYDAFRTFDFYGRKAFKDGEGFSTNEKENLLMKHWYPFHQGIIDSIQNLDSQGYETILLVDYHNTAGDHALNKNQDYMSSMILSNLGSEQGRGNNKGLSIPHEYLYDLSNHIEKNLGISTEINKIYRGGYNLYWYTHLREMLNIKAKIFALQIEYNLDYVFNPITKKFDEDALNVMQKSINDGLVGIYDKIHKNIPNRKVTTYW